MLVAACSGRTPERAVLLQARTGGSGGQPWIELDQRLRFSPTLIEALDNGIPLQLGYRFDWCEGAHSQGAPLQLRYAPLSAHYELVGIAGPSRRFAQRAALLAALDRVRLPLAKAPPLDCALVAEVALQLTALPTPLRFPALFEPDQWRMVSAETRWPPVPR